ncbi:MAG: hypothetical protein D6808_01220 [Candidatus Dadabacteria bacterium]|nr:MAG: hypothetical protein D6808_01220 [Candidatus Dadabacteria bacterium]
MESKVQEKKGTLAELVEKIVEKGTLTPEDQAQINARALKSASRSDFDAIKTLTEKIQGKDIVVL